MAERTYPREFTELLPDESARWVSLGLINGEERASILKLYPESAGASRDRTVLILSILGSLLVAAGVITFFAANWPQISAAVKVASIMVAILGTYAAGFYLTYRRDDYPRLGQSLIFLGGLFYGGGIFLIAQIFHLDSHFPNGFLLWGIGVLPVAWAAASSPMLYLATALLTAWTLFEQGRYGAFNYFYPLVLLGLVLPLTRRLQNWLTEAAVLGCLFTWFAANAGSHGFALQNVNAVFAIGRLLLLYGVAVAALGLAGLGDLRAYLSVGSIGLLGGAFILSFHTPRYVNAEVPSLFAGTPYLITGTLFILMLVVGALWMYGRSAGRDRMLLLPVFGVLAIAAVVAGVPSEIVRMVVFNVLLFGATVGLILFGISRRIGWLVNLGLVAFIIHMLTRYFDLFYSAMSRSAFFLLGGILLLGGGWLLERNRRRWMQGMGGDGNVR